MLQIEYSSVSLGYLNYQPEEWWLSCCQPRPYSQEFTRRLRRGNEGHGSRVWTTRRNGDIGVDCWSRVDERRL